MSKSTKQMVQFISVVINNQNNRIEMGCRTWLIYRGILVGIVWILPYILPFPDENVTTIFVLLF